MENNEGNTVIWNEALEAAIIKINDLKKTVRAYEYGEAYIYNAYNLSIKELESLKK